MQRIRQQPRPDWPARVEALGFSFHTGDGPYWDEQVYYRFTAEQIDLLEATTEALHGLCLEAVETIIQRDWFDRLGISRHYADWIAASWQQHAPTLYGRFDLCYDGHAPPKLLEYNADTPTALLEASVIQWYWLQDCFPAADQFNSLHEQFIARWRHIIGARLDTEPLYFTCVRDHEEDLVITEYLRDLAIQAGAATQFLYIDEIGWQPTVHRFVDLQERPIRELFKLYPWEWLFAEEFGPHLRTNALSTIIEPPWKVLLSGKGLLAVLWELFPGHPNLLPATLEPPAMRRPYVRKPLFGREGEGVQIVQRPDRFAHNDGSGTDRYVWQEYCLLPCFDGHYPVIGSWIVGDTAAGIGIREANTPITTNTSRFVPHCFTD
jgi:glutathionylspermidine synthase